MRKVPMQLLRITSRRQDVMAGKLPMKSVLKELNGQQFKTQVFWTHCRDVHKPSHEWVIALKL